jgi:hypothetical protein
VKTVKLEELHVYSCWNVTPCAGQIEYQDLKVALSEIVGAEMSEKEAQVTATSGACGTPRVRACLCAYAAACASARAYECMDLGSFLARLGSPPRLIFSLAPSHLFARRPGFFLLCCPCFAHIHAIGSRVHGADLLPCSLLPSRPPFLSSITNIAPRCNGRMSRCSSGKYEALHVTDTSPRPQAIMRRLDLNGDGFIDIEEFGQAWTLITGTTRLARPTARPPWTQLQHINSCG